MADLLARPCFSHCLVTYSGMTDCITPFARRVMLAVGDKFYKKDRAADANGYGHGLAPSKNAKRSLDPETVQAFWLVPPIGSDCM